MTGPPVVRPLVRNHSELLLLSRSDATDATGKWGTVSGPADTDPERAARRELLSSTDLSSAEFTLVRAGEPLVVDGSEQCRVHPFLFDCERRDIASKAAARAEWAPPTVMLARETVPGLWRTYDRVRPTVETVAGDTEHGSTRVSIRALEVLRDEAALAAHTQESDAVDTDSHDDRSVAAVAAELVAARPSMTAVANRVHRAVAAADEPADVASTAHEGISRARRVDGEAAAAAVDLLGDSVATLSRSGTVRRTLGAADPGEVLVATSRPGREGVGVAVDLSDAGSEPRVTLTTDTAFAGALATRPVETLVLGADTVLADGRVVNKVGTRGAALAAAHEGIDVVVVAASDKISPGTSYDPEQRDPAEVYDGDAPVSVTSPTFDVTPSGAVDAVVTERGALDTGDIAEIAAEHRALRD
jgi:translation initiation factor 2B subunit (eIF-2B alpha/beta/delta family)